jgi:hypothetical protein
MFPGLARVRRKRTAVLDVPGRRVRPMVGPVRRDIRSRPACPAGHPVPSRECGPAAGSRLKLSPRTLRLPRARRLLGPARQASEPRVPDRQTHRWPPDGSVRGPTVRSSGPAAAVARASKGSKGVGADPRRQRAALEVARHSAAHRRLPTGAAPDPPAKLMNPGARLNQRTPVRAY